MIGYCTKTIKARYDELKEFRQVYLERARDCAALTIPTLFPPEWNDRNTKYKTPWQSVGAEGVNNLAAKLLMALFPPNTPVFRYSLDEQTLEELAQDEKLRTQVEGILSKVEQKVTFEIEARAIRSPVHEAFLQNIVAGNVLLYIPAKGGMRAFPLNKYVVKRDPLGKVMEIIVCETLPFSSLPEKVQRIVRPHDELTEENIKNHSEDVEVYTYCWFEKKKCYITQEVNGTEIVESRSNYDEDEPPFIAVRCTRVDGEDYGRSFVESWLGDLRNLEMLNRAIAEGSAISSKVLFMLNPSSLTRAKDLAEAENGQFVVGNANEVTTLQVQKYNDFRVALEHSNTIEERLRKAFLMTASIQRNGDRVTATEWQMLAQELETTLGGMYSLMAQELQLPLVKRLLAILKKEGLIPKMPKDVAMPTIIAGMEALGRGNDLNKLKEFLGTLAQTIGAEQMMQWINTPDVISRVASSLGINTSGLIKTEEQIAQEQQQAQMQAMMQQMMPTGDAMANLGGKAMQSNPEMMQQMMEGQMDGTGTEEPPAE